MIGPFGPSAPRHALVQLARLAQREPAGRRLLREALEGRLEELAETAIEVAAATGDPVGQVIAELIAAHPSPPLVDRVVDACDRLELTTATSLRELASLGTRRLVHELTERASTSGEPSGRAELARLSQNLALRLSATGDGAEAAAFAEGAVEHYRRLAAEDPDTHLGGLVASLNTLALVVAPREPARAEALLEDCLSRLDAAPGRLASTLGVERLMVLDNLSWRLAERGESARAVALAEGAVALADVASRAVDPAVSRAAYRRWRAQSRARLAGALRADGQTGRAAGVAQEAVDDLEQLWFAAPDTAAAELARALTTLAVCRSDLGEQAEALAAARRAVRLLTELARDRRTVFASDLALALDDLGAILLQASAVDEAVAASRLAIELCQEQVDRLPEPFSALLCEALTLQAAALLAGGRREAAESVAQRAVELAARLPATGAGDHARRRSDRRLAVALHNLGTIRAELEQPEAAEEHFRAALRLFAETERQPSRPSAEVASCWNNLGAALRARGALDDARHALETAVELRRTLAAAAPRRFSSDLAASLNNLGNLLADRGEHAEAAATLREAVDLRRRLFALDSARSALPLASAWANLVFLLLDAGRGDQAAEEADAALHTLRERIVPAPEPLPTELRRLGHACAEALGLRRASA